MQLVVAKDGQGDYRTIGEAIEAIPYEEPSTVQIKPGIYREKLFCDKADLTLIGEDADNTVLSWGDGASHIHADGTKFGTFRSYTAFFGGGRLNVENLTIENTAGDGRIAGQAIAAYVDTKTAYFQNVRLLGRQDTLFAAPLPPAPRISGSFVGPRKMAPRTPSTQYYLNCSIEGDIDFIFGGAQAVFDGCEIVSLNRGESVNGYVTAPCTPNEQEFGFLFLRCHLKSSCPAETVYLGRPWRAFGKAAFLECEMDNHIIPAGWDNWSNAENEKTAWFAEYQNSGAGNQPTKRVSWCKMLSKPQAERIVFHIQTLKEQCQTPKKITG